jgi:hypothetical protein
MIRREQMAQTKNAQQRAGESTMTRLTGEPIMRILCKKTDTLVGYLYQWNNGDLQPAWLTPPWLRCATNPSRSSPDTRKG